MSIHSSAVPQEDWWQLGVDGAGAESDLRLPLTQAPEVTMGLPEDVHPDSA